jgi:hypothetical protein
MSQPPCLLARGCQPFPSTARNDADAGSFAGFYFPHSSAWVAGVARWLLWLDPSGTLSAGFPPSAVPLLNAGRLPLVPLLKYGSFEQLLDKRTGALLVLPLSGIHHDMSSLSVKGFESAYKALTTVAKREWQCW